jgi:uncharacterized protein with HEPN domain
MPPRREDLYLVDIVEACRDIATFLANLSLDEWMADPLRRDAVLYNLMVIGEAANRTSAELRGRHDNVPWREIVGFRNVTVHEYFAVEWHVVWRVARRQVPELEADVVAILRDEYPEVAARLESRGGRPRTPGAWRGQVAIHDDFDQLDW